MKRLVRTGLFLPFAGTLALALLAVLCDQALDHATRPLVAGRLEHIVLQTHHIQLFFLERPARTHHNPEVLRKAGWKSVMAFDGDPLTKNQQTPFSPLLLWRDRGHQLLHPLELGRSENDVMDRHFISLEMSR